MNEYLKQVNSLPFYLITGGVLLFILIMCVVFLVKSYRRESPLEWIRR